MQSYMYIFLISMERAFEVSSALLKHRELQLYQVQRKEWHGNIQFQLKDL